MCVCVYFFLVPLDDDGNPVASPPDPTSPTPASFSPNGTLPRRGGEGERPTLAREDCTHSGALSSDVRLHTKRTEKRQRTESQKVSWRHCVHLHFQKNKKKYIEEEILVVKWEEKKISLVLLQNRKREKKWHNIDSETRRWRRRRG